jgi:hypothetical protein
MRLGAKELELTKSPELAVGKIMAKKKNKAIERRLHVCCSYSKTGITTVLKSVART